MTALELILLELILVPAAGSQFACVHNNETQRHSQRVRAKGVVARRFEGVEGQSQRSLWSAALKRLIRSSMASTHVFFFHCCLECPPNKI